jgi:hypothetical protein
MATFIERRERERKPDSCPTLFAVLSINFE